MGKALDLHTPLPELVERLRVRSHLPICAGADDQVLGQFLDDLVECVPVLAHLGGRALTG